MSAPASSKTADWQFVLADSSSAKQAGPTREQRLALRAVPAGLHAPLDKAGKKARGDLKEKNITVGNDQVVPWTKPLKDRSIIKMVATLAIITPLTSSAVANTFAGFTITVAGMDNFTSIAAVYDEYHIAECEVLLTPAITEVISGGTAVGNWVSAVDIDDGNAPTVYDQVASYPSSVSSQGTVGHYHRWSPQYAVATYSGAFTSYSAARGWVDCASPNVQWYGVKMASLISAATQTFTATTRITILFRGIH